MNWFAIRRYRSYPSWVATLTCGHSGVVEHPMAFLPPYADYVCALCPDVQKLVHSAMLEPTGTPR